MPQKASSAHPDAELLDRAGHGDEAAFTALYRRHYGAVRRLAYTYRLRGDPDDLVDGTFAQVVEALRRRSRPAGSFRAHLFATLRELAGGRPEAAAPGVAGPIPTAVEAVSGRSALGGAERATIDKAFAGLSERWQVIAWHTVIDGCDPSALSRRLGVSPEAAEVQARRALAKLRQSYLEAEVSAAPRPACTPFRARLGAHQRGSLSATDAEATRAHLDRCDACSTLTGRLDDIEDRLAWSVAPLFPHVVMASATGPSPVADGMIVREPDLGYRGRRGRGLCRPLRSPGHRRYRGEPGSGDASGASPSRRKDTHKDATGPRHLVTAGRSRAPARSGSASRTGGTGPGQPGARQMAVCAAVVVFIVGLAAVGSALTGTGDDGSDGVEVAAEADVPDDEGTGADDEGPRSPSALPADAVDIPDRSSTTTTGGPPGTAADEDAGDVSGSSSSPSSTSSSSSSSTSSSTSTTPGPGAGTPGPTTPTTDPPTTDPPTTDPTDPPDDPAPEEPPLTFAGATWTVTGDGRGELTVAVARPVPLASTPNGTSMNDPCNTPVVVTVEAGDAVRLAADLDARCAPSLDVGDLAGSLSCTLDPPTEGSTVGVTLPLTVDAPGQQATVAARRDGELVGEATVDLTTTTTGTTPA